MSENPEQTQVTVSELEVGMWLGTLSTEQLVYIQRGGWDTAYFLAFHNWRNQMCSFVVGGHCEVCGFQSCEVQRVAYNILNKI